MNEKANAIALAHARAHAKEKEARSAYHAHQKVSALTEGWEGRYKVLRERLLEAARAVDAIRSEARRAGVALPEYDWRD